MKINEIYVENFRSIKKASISFIEGKHAIIVGENGTGKTHILEAIHYFFCSLDINNKDVSNIVDSGKKLKFELKFNSRARKKMKVNKIKHKHTGEYIYSFAFNSKKGVKSPRYMHLNDVSLTIEESIDILNYIKSEVTVMHIPTLAYTDNFDEHLLKILNFKDTDKNLTFKELNFLKPEHTLNNNISIDINIAKKIGGKDIHLSKLNSGHKRELFDKIIANQSSGKKNLIILYDEFELHYHPLKIIEEYNKLNSQDLYSIITTHSRELIDKTDLSKFTLVKDNKTHDIDFSMKPKIMKTTKMNGSILFAKKLIFCEGYSDAFFLKILVSKYVSNNNQIEIISLESCNNHALVKKFLDCNKIKNYLFVLDQDALYAFDEHSVASDNSILKNSIVTEFSIDSTKLEKLFKKHSFKKKQKIMSNGFPCYNKNKRKMSIGKGNSSKYFFWKYDLEYDIFLSKKGKLALRSKIPKIKYLSDITPDCVYKYKEHNIEIIQIYFNKVLCMDDLTVQIKELIRKIENC